MTYLNYTCKGESHIASGKPCQDYSFSNVYHNGIGVAIVSDGHGGRRYFRSDVGSRLATEITRDKLNAFIENFGNRFLKNSPLVRRSAIKTQIKENDFNKHDEIDKAFRQLFASILYEWKEKILHHAEKNPLTEKERPVLEPLWIEEFEKGENLEKIYGCTLIAAAFTPSYWLAFQIGDGKCFSVDESGEWHEPIPWDDTCFLNKTTSMCDEDALDEFRYCYEGKKRIPIAIFLATDGLDDTFGSEINQENFYVQILKSIIKEGKFATEKDIRESLPELSKSGSKDDMSISILYDEKRLRVMLPCFIRWQIKNIERDIEGKNKKIEVANKIQQKIESMTNPDKTALIELQYANSDEAKALAEKERLEERITILRRDLSLAISRRYP